MALFTTHLEVCVYLVVIKWYLLAWSEGMTRWELLE